MKKIIFSIVPFLFFLLFQTGCTSKMTPTVAKNADLSTNYKNIKTYSWTSDIDNIPNDQLFIGMNGIYIFNNESARKMIKDAIQYELDSRGYKKVKGDNGDMKVSFSVLEREGRLKTTNGYVTLSSGEKVRTDDNVSYTDVKPGTLIINLIDSKQKVQIWQGFASGILQPDNLRDQSKVRQAVSSIFSKFQHNNHSNM
ncbi:DUF4136 domain-containing protein [Segetibacter koreensis]|uniref:DUF4136 domain-containing protein n=1 Tax=Segetibacter koreensis TaxID=398037 RepID=UPI000372F1E8|nr:DUF4136 domain-containing protein [Segetibacter koreensis]